jgi:hypothetical protein
MSSFEQTFDATDPADVEARQQEEARLLETGTKLLEEQEKVALDTYNKSREDAEAELRYAGKFKSAEDLEKAYLELQKKLGSKDSTDESEESVEEQTEDTAESEDTSDTSDPIVQDLVKASEEFYTNNNQLSDETLQRLKELPSEQLIEAYIKWQSETGGVAKAAQPLTEADAQDIVQSVGGADAYNETLAWASENLSPKEVAAYDNVVNSGNKDAIFFAVQALNQRYKDAVGFEGKTVSGKSVKSTVKGFRSQAELARAISDPRYSQDPAYRYDIEQRLAASGDLM